MRNRKENPCQKDIFNSIGQNIGLELKGDRKGELTTPQTKHEAIVTNGPRELGTFETLVKFKQRSVLQVDVYRRNGNKRVQNENSIRNLLSQEGNGNSYNGYLSPSTKRKLEEMLCVWLTSIELNVDLKSMKKKVNESSVFPTFVTLTLPAAQFHKDSDIRESILHPFINWLKQSESQYYQRGKKLGQQKGFGVKAYFWRAEAQKKVIFTFIFS